MREAKVNPSSLFTMSVDDIVRAVSARVLQEIPENVKTNEDLARIEEMLARLANDYAYLVTLAAYSQNYSRRLKREGKESKEMWEDMLDKNAAIESMSSAVKLQYQAVSRILTIKTHTMDQNDMHEFRREKGVRGRAAVATPRMEWPIRPLKEINDAFK